MKYLPLLTLFSITTLTSTGQSWLEKSLKKVAKEAATETTKSQTAKLDSIDFQFVMSVSEGSSMFEIEQKFETVSKTSSSLFKLLDDDEKKRAKTIQEIARDTLQAAIRLYEIRSYKLASEGFVNAKAYMEANDLKQELTYLRCITSLGIMYLVQGRNHDAAENITYALTQSSEVLGQKSAAYAANLNSQAKLDQLSGKYNEAEIAFDQVISIIQKIVGEKSMQYAIVLNNKALLYQVMGRFPESVELMKKSIAASEAAPKKVTQSGKKSFDNRKFLSNLAVTYQLSGNLPEAEKQYLYIKDIFETRMFQKGNSEYASLLNQLGVLYIQMGKMDQVENLLKKSAEECKKFFTNEENAAFAKTQNDLGNFYRIQGRFAEAETTLQKAVDIRKRVLGENHPDYVKSIENLGILYWKKGELEKAYTPLHEATDQSLNFINSYFPPMSETEKTKYWDVLQPRFQRFYNYAIEASASNPEVLKDVYNYQIATKALLLNSTNKIKKTILSSGDQSLIDTYLSWIAQKENLSRYYALSKEDLLQQKIDLVELEKTANNSERELSQRSSAFSQAFSSEKIDFTQVAAQLTDTESLLEFIRVRSFDKDFTSDARYLVLALTKNATEPKMVILQNGNQLETRYAKYYKNSIQQKTPDEFSYDQFWKGVDPLLTGKKTVYISPDGVYNQINLNTLKPKEGDYILNRYDLVIIGNSKDLIALKQRKVTTARKDAFLLGFPDYNGAAVPLPGTKIEVEGINKILQVAGYKTSLQEEKNASEANLKAVKGPALIHLATHGYFLADSDLQGGGDALGVNAENAKNNPLLRSGLILAGAKTNENKDVNLTSNDNGILTAYEAMSLNLEGTDLIILSACETGLGDVRAGEGVYGLQRSFLIAGANALVMSLWKVDDAATQQLMTNFYTNWTKGGSKLKAFKQAQQQLKLKFKEPYYWGAFVMMGM